MAEQCSLPFAYVHRSRCRRTASGTWPAHRSHASRQAGGTRRFLPLRRARNQGRRATNNSNTAAAAAYSLFEVRRPSRLLRPFFRCSLVEWKLVLCELRRIHRAQVANTFPAFLSPARDERKGNGKNSAEFRKTRPTVANCCVTKANRERLVNWVRADLLAR